MAGQATIMNQLLGQQRTPAPEIRSGESFGAQPSMTSETALAQAMMSSHTEEFPFGKTENNASFDGAQLSTDEGFTQAANEMNAEMLGSKSANADTLNFADQLRMLGESRHVAPESFGIDTRSHSTLPKSQEIFNRTASNNQKRLNSAEEVIRQFQEEKSQAQHSAVEAEKSAQPLREEEQLRIAQLAAKRKEIRGLIKKDKRLGTESGAKQMLHLQTEQHVEQADSSSITHNFIYANTLVQKLKRLRSADAFRIQQERKAKLRAHKGGFEGGKDSGMPSMEEVAKREAPHEQTMGE